MIVTLVSAPSTDQGTFGMVTLEDGTAYHSIELPWHDNQNGISCLPAGEYQCEWFNSPKHGMCYLIDGTAPREMCEFHSANFAGDADKGYDKQLMGCVALGMAIGLLQNSQGKMQMAVLYSKDAIADFDARLAGATFTLQIVRH